MALNRLLLVAVLGLGIDTARCESFRLQRVGSAEEPQYPGSFDKRKIQPVRIVNLGYPNGTVQPLTAAQARLLDTEPLEVWPSETRNRNADLEAFVKTSLVPFLRLLRKPNGAVPFAARIAAEAANVFSSVEVPATFEQLAMASANPEGNEPEIRDCVSRLNLAFHAAGLHLTFGRFSQFDGGTVELSVYSVSERLLVQVNDRTLPVYTLQPFDESFRVLAMGMMEPFPPRIFIFADMIELQFQDMNVFLAARKDYPFEDPNVPVAMVPAAVQAKVNQIVRNKLLQASGVDRLAVRRWLLRSVARHEGQHLYIDRAMKDATESGKIEWDDFNRFHERQAYLFELETSDPEFTPFVLLASFAISAALSDKYSRMGSGAALRGLQKQLPVVRFWESDFNRPITDGLIPLFNASPADIRSAASRARLEFEKFITSARR